MLKKLALAIILSLLCLTTIGCSWANDYNSSDHSDSSPATENSNQTGDLDSGSSENNPPQDPIIEADPIQEKIDQMSLKQKIGQMLIAGLDGYTVDENAIQLIEDYFIGGFILFGHNIESSEQLLGLVNDLKTANSPNSIPLFFSVDEEGGKVSRMPDDLNKIPSSRFIGEKNDLSLSFNIGKVIADEIKSFGFNMNFAPVLDIDSNPDNPVIGDRSFGADETIVSQLGIQTMKGIQSNNVIPVAKHFPGHGDTSVDSHIGLPVVEKDLASLMQFELVPFIEAIKNGADGIMVAHILFNKIDSANPASLSSEIIGKLLRSELEFDGLIITDDMTMGAIVENYDIADAVVKSVIAGSDIVLVCHGYENQIKALDGLEKAVEKGQISEERLDESVYRILKLKDKYNIKDEIIEGIDIDKINSRIDAILG